MPYSYPGFPAFLARSREALNLSVEVDSLARTQAGLTRCSNLLAQVQGARPERRQEILDAAIRHRNSIILAGAAADAAIAEVAAEFGLFTPFDVESDAEVILPDKEPTGEAESIKPRRIRKVNDA